jgi:hypothetical protein
MLLLPIRRIINHKYPIDTKKHIQGSWSAIHIKSHAAKYSKAELDVIESKIRAAGETQGLHFKNSD